MQYDQYFIDIIQDGDIFYIKIPTLGWYQKGYMFDKNMYHIPTDSPLYDELEVARIKLLKENFENDVNA